MFQNSCLTKPLMAYPFLQDIRQTPEYANFMTEIGWQVEELDKLGFRRGIYLFLKKLPLLPFSFIKILRAKRLIPLTELKKYHPLFIKQQPFILENVKNKPGLKHLPGGVAPAAHLGGEIVTNTPPKWSIDYHPLIPTKTIWIDLTKTENQLLKELRSKTRYNLNKAQKSSASRRIKTIIIPGNKITSQQLQDFYNLWKINKPFNWLFKPSFNELKSLIESFGNKCFFVFAITNHQSLITNHLLASCLILYSSNMSFYWHNFSSKEGKKFFAPTLCIWKAILEAKKRGLKVFDFEGIWDERFPNLNKGWQGFSRFKKSFGGEKIKFR